MPVFPAQRNPDDLQTLDHEAEQQARNDANTGVLIVDDR
jgi:hypothetical protein